jgi:hypothetical protein
LQGWFEFADHHCKIVNEYYAGEISKFDAGQQANIATIGACLFKQQ